jgi:hypothetical protein
MNATDIDLATDLWARRMDAILLQRWGRRVSDLHLKVHAGGLALYGRAPTYYAKQLAQHAAVEASGLFVTANEIDVG